MIRFGSRVRMMGAFVSLTTALAAATAVKAAPVWDYPVTLEQPDGTPVRVLLSGDEFYNWAHDEDGYAIIRHPQNGRLVYADESNDGLAPTEHVVNKVNPRLIGLKPHIAEKQAASARLMSPIRMQLEQRKDAPQARTTGTFNNIVVFIRFADEAATAFTHPLSAYDAMLNGVAGTNSMRNYYKEVSYNSLTINSLYYPTQSGTTVVSFQDSHSRGYFKPYDATTNPTGYQNDSGTRERNLLVAALNAVKSTIDSSGIDTDSDNDGYVDNVVFVVDGDTTAWATLLWPHMSWLGGGPTLGGATVGTYNFQLETFLFAGRGVGVFCHEMFHSLGGPDLYHYTGNGIAPAGAWDIMESDRNPPQHMTAHMKWKYGHWLGTIPEITTSGTYTLQPATSPTNNSYIIRSMATPTQYFVLEYRRKTGTFESSVPGSGLIVSRIDTTVGDGNADGPPDEVYIYRPNGTATVNGDVNSAHLSATVGRTALNSTTNPTPFLKDGSYGLLDIHNVTSSGSTISFDVSIVYPPATRVGFIVQPGPMQPGTALSPQPVVAAMSSLGVVNPNYTGTVTVALKSGTGTSGAVLGGTKTVTLVNGRATFNDLSLDMVGSGYVLTATCSGLAGGDSAPFSVTPSGAATMRMNLSGTHLEAERPWADSICVSGDGKFVAFNSAANNLVPNDTNTVDDVFVRNLSNGTYQVASVSTSGVFGNGNSGTASLSATGAYVVFESSASNLVSGDTNGVTDVFIRDLSTGVTERVSVGASGVQANNTSYSGAVSMDGRYVAFQSSASNLVTGDTNNTWDIFVRDRTNGTTQRISVGPGGVQGNSASYRRVTMSNDGNFVAFQSYASNLVAGDTNGSQDAFVWDRSTGLCERASIGNDGSESNGTTYDVSVNATGQYVVFSCDASNLIASGTNGYYQIFLRDRTAGTTERISMNTSGGDPNNYSWYPDVSPDGRYVVFESWSDNLVSGDTNGTQDVFLRDRQLGTTRRANVSSGQVQAAEYSEVWAAGRTIAPGPIVVFGCDSDLLVTGDANGVPDVFAKNMANNAIIRASSGPASVETGGGGSYNPVITADGRYVVYQSTASNLAAGHYNWTQDIFLRDTYSGSTERVSLTDTGALADADCIDPSINSDATMVSFTSRTSGLVPGGDGGYQHIYVRNRSTGRTIWVSSANGGGTNGNSVRSTLSPDGRYVAFISWATNLVNGDTNGQPDVFWKDLQTGTLKRVSVSSTGAQGTGSCDVWLLPRVSSGGRYVAFASYASNLVTGDTNGKSDVFVYDTTANIIECVSVDAAGKPGNNTSWWADMSDDGRYVVFMSEASNLVASDTNAQADIFVRDRVIGKTYRVSVGLNGTQSIGNSRDPSISSTGRYVTFKSTDGNLVTGDTNGQTDAFMCDLATGQTVRLSEGDTGMGGNGESSNVMGVSADGKYAVFQSWANNLVPGDNNTAWDIYRRGPLWTVAPQYTLNDAANALQVAAGISKATFNQTFWLDVVQAGGSQGKVEVSDAVAVVRKAAGLDTNP